jgi:ferredoxin
MAQIPVIDEAACLAHGDCEELAPDVFHIEDVATVIGTAFTDNLISIAEVCPAGAISVIDPETGEQVYP